MARMTVETENFRSDILLTALEGPLGCVGMSLESYRYYSPTIGGSLEPSPAGGGNVKATILDDDGTTHDVTMQTFTDALRNMRARAAHDDLALDLLSSLRDHDWDYDWSDAMNILQYGIYGEVVFG